MNFLRCPLHCIIQQGNGFRRTGFSHNQRHCIVCRALSSTTGEPTTSMSFASTACSSQRPLKRKCLKRSHSSYRLVYMLWTRRKNVSVSILLASSSATCMHTKQVLLDTIVSGSIIALKTKDNKPPFAHGSKPLLTSVMCFTPFTMHSSNLLQFSPFTVHSSNLLQFTPFTVHSSNLL